MMIAILIPTLITIVVILLIIACVLLVIKRKGPISERIANKALNKGENVQLHETALKIDGVESNTTDEGTPLNESTSVDTEAEKEASIIAGDNNIIRNTCTIKEGEITTKASREMERAIVGVTALEKLIYIISDKSSEVEMFDITTYKFMNLRNLAELENPWDMTSCKLNKRLYIMDLRSPTTTKKVICVDSNVNLVHQWSTGDKYGNLSVASDGNVIVTFCDSRRLQIVICGPNELNVNVVSLSEDRPMIYPSHALKLRYGMFLICHGINTDNPTNPNVWILNEKRKRLKENFVWMVAPSYLAEDETGLVFIADQRNNRVNVLNSELKLIGEVITEQNELRGPQRFFVHGNGSTGKLFVVDNDIELESKRRDGKVLIFSYELLLR